MQRAAFAVLSHSIAAAVKVTVFGGRSTSWEHGVEVGARSALLEGCDPVGDVLVAVDHQACEQNGELRDGVPLDDIMMGLGGITLTAGYESQRELAYPGW
jgi:hypothetical protein